ncbi:MAG: TRAP transporter large permease subunit [Alphaproteobacteria bacterium]|nr:TRAP transporter large permease subunit [Alphaproteobacteria bacterium]
MGLPAQEIVCIVMVVVTLAGVLAGYPVAFTLGGVSLLFALGGWLFGLFDLAFVTAIVDRIFGFMMNEVLVAVPLFVFMGMMLERSKVAEDLLINMGALFGTMRGGLAVSVTIVGALLAASTGIVGATVVTMGLLALPVMLRHGYDPALACGSIAAAGTLGQIIPPSLVLVLLGDILSASYQAAQLKKGIFAPESVSVTDLFAGALLPGLALAGLYALYQLAIAWVRPASSPAVPRAALPATAAGRNPALLLAETLVPPVVLIVAVLGSILGGIATPTEAAAVGAVGATMLAGLKLDPRRAWIVRLAAVAVVVLLVVTAVFDLRVARTRIGTADGIGIAIALAATAVIAWGLWVSLAAALRADVLRPVMRTTAQLTAMIFVIIIGAGIFSLVFRGFGGEELVHEFLKDLPGGVAGAVFVVMLVMFLLGFFLDVVEIIFVVVPIVAPALLAMDISPVWLGVMMALNLQTSYLTPPFALSLFYLRSVVPAGISTRHLYVGVIPFVAIQLVALVALAAWPGLATWLPRAMFD